MREHYDFSTAKANPYAKRLRSGELSTPTTRTRSKRSGKIEIYCDNQGEYRWRLKSANGATIANGGEGFHEKRSCLNSIASVKRNLAASELADLTKQ